MINDIEEAIQWLHKSKIDIEKYSVVIVNSNGDIFLNPDPKNTPEGIVVKGEKPKKSKV